MPPPEDGQSPTAPVIPSLARTRLADQIADVLREQMLTGTLQPGDPIHERDTSAALGVSRTPLREALLILEAEGLIETSPARSPIVAAPSLEDLSQLLAVLATLEALAGELACANATPKDLRAIRALYEDLVETDSDPDTVSHFKTDMAFHSTIVAASRNQPLIKTHQQYNSRLWRARYMSASRRVGRATSMEDHRMMVEGLEERNSEKTAKTMRNHLESAVKNIAQILGA